MKLAYNHYGSGPHIIILHGLFGSSDNWATLAKKLAQNFSVYIIDQRNHGRSPHSNEMSYDLMAADLFGFMNDEGIDNTVVLGHSMGGKTAMRFAQLYPEKVSKLIVADMGIKRYQPHHQPIFDALNAVNLKEISSRAEAEDQILPFIPEPGVRQFILKSLYRTDSNTFAWRMNAEVLESKIDEILMEIPEVTCDVPAHFIRGTKSNYILDGDKENITRIFPNATFSDMDSGHWLHAEDPQTFLKLLLNYVTG